MTDKIQAGRVNPDKNAELKDRAGAKDNQFKEVPQRLIDAAILFQERNEQYGNNFVKIGEVLHAMYPFGITISSSIQWYRIFTIIMLVMKTTRYAENVRGVGHMDSLDDMTVYAQMAAYMDDRERTQIQDRIRQMAKTPTDTKKLELKPAELANYFGLSADQHKWMLVFTGRFNNLPHGLVHQTRAQYKRAASSMSSLLPMHMIHQEDRDDGEWEMWIYGPVAAV